MKLAKLPGDLGHSVEELRKEKSAAEVFCLLRPTVGSVLVFRVIKSMTGHCSLRLKKSTREDSPNPDADQEHSL